MEGPWSITGYPLDVKNYLDLKSLSSIVSQVKMGEGPILYEGVLVLPEGEAPLDTFIDTTGWGKVSPYKFFV